MASNAWFQAYVRLTVGCPYLDEDDLICVMSHILKDFNMMQTATIFTTGLSQAVRLPLEFRFGVAAVFIRHDPGAGDVVMS